VAQKPKPTGEIRIIKKNKKHEGHHGGAWKVAYADFMTAMMAFFLVMWITGLSQEVKASVAGYFKDPQAFMDAVKAGNAPFAVPGDKPGDQTKTKPQKLTKAQERAKFEDAKKTIEKMVSNTPEFKNLKQHVDVKLTNEGLKIDLLESRQSLFFDAASAHVRPEAAHLLSLVAGELKKLPNKVIIEGHTDSRPLSRADGYTNWELSSDRANSARHIMSGVGVSDSQIAQVRGYAATQPRDLKNPTDPSNRRVTIVVVFKDKEKDQEIDLPDLGK
jgi:chemotaxis protein MotB